MIHHDSIAVRFSDCDPAGIVFFPQYLVMVNDLIEKWFDHGLKINYATLVSVGQTGLPTVRLEVDFTAVSQHGELLGQRLSVRKLGRSSLELHIEFLGPDGELRMRVRQVLVCTSLVTHRPQALPDKLRKAIEPYLEEATA